MHRLVRKIEDFTPADAREEEDARKIMGLLNAQGSACLYRDSFSPGHITTSVLLMSADGTRVLMNHHKSLQKWQCIGGHVDGDFDALAAASRVMAEETGLLGFEAVSPGVFDLDIHPIPENMKRNEPAHEHYDIRFLFRSTLDEECVPGDESIELRWCGYDEALALVPPYAQSRTCRMLNKWKDRFAR